MDKNFTSGIEDFKKHVYQTHFSGMKVGQLNRLLASRREELIKSALREHLGIKEGNIDELLG